MRAPCGGPDDVRRRPGTAQPGRVARCELLRHRPAAVPSKHLPGPESGLCGPGVSVMLARLPEGP